MDSSLINRLMKLIALDSFWCYINHLIMPQLEPKYKWVLSDWVMK